MFWMIVTYCTVLNCSVLPTERVFLTETTCEKALSDTKLPVGVAGKCSSIAEIIVRPTSGSVIFR